MLLVHKGVPQGSILGLLLFTLYVNNFYLSSNKFTFLMYADDTTLLSTYDTFHTNTDIDIATFQRNINEELLRVTTWLSRNKLLINTTKTKITVFHTQQKHISYPDVIINNSHVEIVGDLNYLVLLSINILNGILTLRIPQLSKYIGVLN